MKTFRDFKLIGTYHLHKNFCLLKYQKSSVFEWSSNSTPPGIVYLRFEVWMKWKFGDQMRIGQFLYQSNQNKALEKFLPSHNKPHNERDSLTNLKKKIEKIYANSTPCSQAVSHPSTDEARCCLTSVIGREPVCSAWYGRWQGSKLEIQLFNLSIRIVMNEENKRQKTT